MPQAITRIGGSDHHQQAISVGLVLLTMLGVYAITASLPDGSRATFQAQLRRGQPNLWRLRAAPK